MSLFRCGGGGASLTINSGSVSVIGEAYKTETITMTAGEYIVLIFCIPTGRLYECDHGELLASYTLSTAARLYIYHIDLSADTDVVFTASQNASNMACKKIAIRLR